MGEIDMRLGDFTRGLKYLGKKGESDIVRCCFSPLAPFFWKEVCKITKKKTNLIHLPISISRIHKPTPRIGTHKNKNLMLE